MAAAVPLQHHQCDHDDEHRAGNLRRTRQARAIDPGGEDRQRERLHAEIFAGPDIVQRLEQRQRKSNRKRRPCQRQGDMAGQHETRRAKRAGDLDQRSALRQEHRARGEIDVGIEDEAENEDRARQRANRRKPIFACGAISEQCTECRLHRPDGVENIDIDIRDDIGRECERQRQQPAQRIATGKLVGCHDPGCADACNRGQGGNPGQQQSSVARGARQHVIDEMRPDLGIATECEDGKADERQKDGGGEDDQER